MGAEEEIRELEDEIKKTPYNKATQGHIGRLKAKIARLKSAASRKGGGSGLGYAVRKTGDATAIFVGFPSVGKSTLLNAITNAESKVGAYEFTTLDVVPGMLEFRGAKIQLLDIPGIIEEASSGKGRGREVLSVLRSADLLLIVAAGEVGETERQRKVIEKELYSAGFRLNQEPPDVRITRKNEGGIRVESTRRLGISVEAVKEVLKEFRVLNGEVLIREDIGMDQLVDCLARNRIYLPAIFVANKSDRFPSRPAGFISVSAVRGEGIEKLKEELWKRLGMRRVYLKKPGKPPDMEEPLIMRGRVDVRRVCKKLGLLEGFRSARVWGPSGRFPGQRVGLGHVLSDGDAVEVQN